jgi:hypothetical protein
MRPIRILAVLLLVVLAACGDDKKEVADKIQKDIVAELAVLIGPDSAKIVAYDGVDVVPEGDSFKATVKNLRFLPGEAKPVAIGNVDFQITPKGEDQYDISKLTLPAAIELFESPDGGGPVKLEVGEQNVSGTWSKTLHDFLTLDATYRNLKMANATNEAVTLAEVTAKGSSTEKGNGLYDQTSSGGAKNLQVTSADGTMTIAGVDFTSESHGVKAAELRKFQEQWRTLLVTLGEGKTPNKAVVDQLRTYGNWVADSRARVDVAGISFKEPGGTEAFALEHFIIDGGGSGFDQPKGKFDIAFQNLGLKIPALETNPMAEPFHQFIPVKVNLGFALDDLPPAELWAAFIDFFVSGGFSANDEAALSTAAQTAGFQLLQTLQRAGSSFRIAGWEVETAAARATLDGTVKSDPNSMFGAVASMKAEIGGLDDIIATVQQTMGPDAMSFTGPLEMLRGYANREAGADGKPVDRYAIEFPADGQLTINGKPFDAMGMMMGGAGGGMPMEGGEQAPADDSTTVQ